jgi:hypothetical protein
MRNQHRRHHATKASVSIIGDDTCDAVLCDDVLRGAVLAHDGVVETRQLAHHMADHIALFVGIRDIIRWQREALQLWVRLLQKRLCGAIARDHYLATDSQKLINNGNTPRGVAKPPI